MKFQKQGHLNRGRFQAQGKGLEESRAWSTDDVPYKKNGQQYLDELKGKLTKVQKKERLQCFTRASAWVERAPSDGYDAFTQVVTTFMPSPPLRDVRVDVEIRKGKAFRDNE